ncbi:unnamed protein product, partial [Rotaria sordida]
MDTKR